MGIDAVFELPVHVWLMTDALGQRFRAGYRTLTFDVVMPTGESPNGRAPEITGLDERPELAGEEIRWVHEYGAHIPESKKPAIALHRIAICDADGPTPTDRSWFTPDAQLAEYITPWFNQVRTWVEVLTGQDLDPHHRVYDAEEVGSGLTFLNPDHDGAHGLILTTPKILPVTARDWAAVFRLVKEGKEPPLEELLSRDARASQRRGADRRAVIEAATALEIALGRYVDASAARLPPRQRARLNKRTTLGGYIDVAEKSGLESRVPYERLRWLCELRNEAAHRGEAPSNWDAGSAVQVAIDFLGAHGRYSRMPKRELDGSEFVLIDEASDS